MNSTVDAGGGMSLRSDAAMGGFIAGGVMLLLLSLFGLCCCWGRKRARPKHPQIHFESDVKGVVEESEIDHDFREPTLLLLQGRPLPHLLAVPMTSSPRKPELKIEISQRESPVFQSLIIPGSANEPSEIQSSYSSQSSPQEVLRLSPLTFSKVRIPKLQTEYDVNESYQDPPPFSTPLISPSACSFRSFNDVEESFTVSNPQKLKSGELI